MTHLDREKKRLKQMILRYSENIEEDLSLAIASLLTRDAAMAEQVIGRDDELDSTEVLIEEECLKALSLYQPVANDLRYIVAIMKLNIDLERIADLAVNMAGVALGLIRDNCEIDFFFDLTSMAETVKKMLRNSLRALLELDAGQANAVLGMDGVVDALHKQNYDLAEKAIEQNRQRGCRCFLQMLSVSKYLERIADHSTNIAEDVLYLIGGRIVRHAQEQ